MKENIAVVQKIFLMSFIIGFIVLALVGILFMMNVDFFATLANQMIGIEKETYIMVATLAFAMAKNVLFFIFLIPSIAMKMVLKCKCTKDV